MIEVTGVYRCADCGQIVIDTMGDPVVEPQRCNRCCELLFALRPITRALPLNCGYRPWL